MEILQAYARLIVRAGANVQQKQGVVIYTQPEACHLARLVAQEAYDAGAGWVEAVYADQTIDALSYRFQSPATLSRVPAYQRHRQRFLNRELPCEIYILCEDPEGLSDVDEEVLSLVRQKRGRILKPLRDARENKNQWTIAAAASPAWAKRVFPSLPQEEAVQKLWDAIFACARVDASRGQEAWLSHGAHLSSRAKKMSAYAFQSVHLQSQSTGTDLTIDLIEGALWMGGAEETLSGTVFYPNIPTEEVFTTPCRAKAQGVVYATKPLSFMGQLIEDFSLVFENGRVTSCRAVRGQALLEKMLTLDENASMLGEIALIGKDSPIAQSGVLFYETLFDENASCHLALGAGFSNVLPDFAELSHEQTIARGVNDSVHHTDFMIGAPDMRVTGKTRDGQEVCVFEKSMWTIT